MHRRTGDIVYWEGKNFTMTANIWDCEGTGRLYLPTEYIIMSANKPLFDCAICLQLQHEYLFRHRRIIGRLGALMHILNIVK